MHTGLRRVFCLSAALTLAALFLGSCGILVGEPFIEPVREADIIRQLNDRAVVNLGRYPTGQHDFSHFAIFYRIYISDIYITATTTDTFSTINPALQADFNALSRYIDSDTLFGTNMHNVFSGRSFRYLALEGANINNVMRAAVGETVVFDLSQSQQVPVMRIGPNEHVLLRATSHPGVGGFSPRPEHRRFINSLELRLPGYINLEFNADVVDRAGDRIFTYAAMFIVAVGMNPNTFTNVYSTPSLIHVFRLPQPQP